MAFYRRRPRPDAEKCADPAKARASALETLAGQEVSANMLYERLCRRYTEQAAAAAVAEMVQLDYVNDPLRRSTGTQSAGCPQKPPRRRPEPAPEGACPRRGSGRAGSGLRPGGRRR